MGSSANGNMRRIINFLKGFAKKQQTKYKSGIENFIKKYTIVREKALIVFCGFNSSQKHIGKFVNVYKIIDFILKNISYPLTCSTQLGTI